MPENDYPTVELPQPANLAPMPDPDVSEAFAVAESVMRLFTSPDRTIYFDRQGQPIDIDTYHQLKYASRDADDPSNGYHRVGSDQVGPIWISTVWMGIDLGLMPGPPVIFETMIFGGDDSDDDSADETGTDTPSFDGLAMRYCTEQQAIDGHTAIVKAARLHYGLDIDAGPEQRELNGGNTIAPDSEQ